jgi:hypothetical protein
MLLLRYREPLLGAAAVGVIIEAVDEELLVMVWLRCEVPLP